VWLLHELFSRSPGAVNLRINPALGQAELAWIPARFDLKDYLAEAEAFGYRFGPSRKEPRRRSRELLVRIGVCAAAAGNVMLFSLSYYGGLGLENPILYGFFGQVSLLLTAITVAVGGWVFFRSAASALRRGILHLDVPIALGILLAFAGSLYAHATRGPHAAYFDTVAAFVTLMLVGRWLQESVLERNRNALLASDGIDHLVTRRVREGRLETVPAERIAAGDEIWIVPGDLVPVGGIVLRSTAHVALGWITGESGIRSFEPGETVPAGAFNAGTTALHLVASEDFASSRLTALLAAPQADPRRRMAGEGWVLWSRISAIYVIAVLLLAAAGFAIGRPRGLEEAVMISVSILVVTCPCALGLGTPLAQELAYAGLRRRGVFIREGTFLDRVLSVRKIVFDKTGTLTLDRLDVTAGSLQALAGLAPEDRGALRSMAARSNHPRSRAIARALETGGEHGTRLGAGPEIEGIEVGDDVQEVPGQGIEMRRPGAGAYRLGRRRFAVLEAAAADRTADDRAAGDRIAGDRIAGDQAAGAGPTWFAHNGRPLARVEFLESIKPDAAAEVRALAKDGYQVHLLSGDSPAKTAAVAAALAIPDARAAGGLDPERKAERVRALDAADVLMIGDGINDAPSFDAAFCTGTPAVDQPSLPARADFYFLGDGIAAVRQCLGTARRLRTVVLGNLGFALVYNAVAVALCFAGWIQPVVAAVLMPASSLLVVAHTLVRMSERRTKWTS
jgi:Cu2+-exporting ATPase